MIFFQVGTAHFPGQRLAYAYNIAHGGSILWDMDYEPKSIYTWNYFIKGY